MRARGPSVAAKSGAAPRIVTALCAAALLLAGCAQAASGRESSQEGLDGASGGAGFGEGQGAIAGTLVTEELYPLLEGTVTLRRAGTDLATRPVTDGSFAFGNLEPGDYALEGRAVGYHPGNFTAKVEEGQISQVVLTLRQVRSDEPFVSVVVWTGMIECEVAFVVWIESCGLQPSTQSKFIDIPETYDGAVFESTWRAAGEDMGMWLTDQTARGTSSPPSSKYLLETKSGGRPLRLDLIPGQTRTEPALYDWATVPEEKAYQVRQDMWWNGRDSATFQPLAPVCTVTYSPTCAGVGVTIAFRFDNFVSIFVHERPGDLEAYSALPDS